MLPSESYETIIWWRHHLHNPKTCTSALHMLCDITALREAFNMFDKDKNGQISQDELMCVMQSLGMKPTEQEVQDIINEFDIDSECCIMRMRGWWYINRVLAISVALYTNTRRVRATRVVYECISAVHVMRRAPDELCRASYFLYISLIDMAYAFNN